MIFITGDVHGRPDRFSSSNFRKGNRLGKDDYMIVCGDFGCIWTGDPYEQYRLDRLEELPFTLLFITGNHENYDIIESYPVSEWHGGKVQFIRPHVIHLMRGQVFDIEGKTFFTMGGAECHDLWNGVLDPADPNFIAKSIALQLNGEFFRVKGESWWPQEIPTEEDYEEGRKNLRAHGMKVDYVLSHCAPTKLQEELVPVLHHGEYPRNSLTDFLQEVSEKTEFRKWYFGHYHVNKTMGRYNVLYERIERIS